MRFQLKPVGLGYRSELAKKGCYDGSSFVSEGERSFEPYPMEKIQANKTTIARLQGNIERLADKINSKGESAKSYYQDYLDTTIPICGTFTWDKEACFKSRTALGVVVDKANAAIAEMTQSKRELYAYYSELMVWAPSKAEWGLMCQHKGMLERSFENLTDEVLALNTAVRAKLQAEDAEQANASVPMDRFTSALVTVRNTMDALSTANLAAFKQILTGVAGAARVVSRYPQIIWLGVGALAVGSAATFGAPYLKLLLAWKSKK